MAKRKSMLLFEDIRSLVLEARTAVAQSANLVQVWTNFQIGRIIIEHEQKGTVRAGYAQRLPTSLSTRLTTEFGRGFSRSNLEYFRKFYLTYRGRISQSLIGKSGKMALAGKMHNRKTTSVASTSIPQSLIAKSDIFKLSWTHYLFLMSIDDEDERSFYEIEAASERWSIRELRRQFNSSLYERLALSRNKKKVRELAKKGQRIEQPQDAIKEPVVLEFLGLDEKASYTESNLESAIIDKIEHFLL